MSFHIPMMWFGHASIPISLPLLPSPGPSRLLPIWLQSLDNLMSFPGGAYGNMSEGLFIWTWAFYQCLHTEEIGSFSSTDH